VPQLPLCAPINDAHIDHQQEKVLMFARGRTGPH
jgi:hypothetical protein